MSEKDEGGPMFPHEGGAAFPLAVPSEFQFFEGGMTLRDWFAGQALISILGAVTPDELPVGEKTKEAIASVMASWGYAVADAMLKEREK